MRALLPLLLAACTAAPIFTPTGEPLVRVEIPPVPTVSPEAFALLPVQTAAASIAAASAPSPLQRLADRDLWSDVVGHLDARKAADGTWVIQVPPAGASLAASNAAISALNIPGNQTADISSNLTLPLGVKPGDSVVIWTPGWQQASVLSFVSFDLRPFAVLRPPAVGRPSNPLVRFLRDNPILETWLDFSRVPRVVKLSEVYGPGGVDETQWGAARPSASAILQRLAGYSGDVWSDWRCAGRVPTTNHRGYGTDVAGEVSTAMLLGCSTEPEREAILLALAQRGLDTLGQMCDGYYGHPLGGHFWGRYPPVVLLGHLLGLDVFADPTPVLGARLPELNGFTVEVPWFGGVARPCWHFSPQDPVGIWTRPPSTWGPPEDPTHASFGWQVRYMGQVLPAQLGSATALTLMGRPNSTYLRAVLGHFKGLPADAMADLQSAGVGPLFFGTDFAGPAGFASFCARRYLTP